MSKQSAAICVRKGFIISMLRMMANDIRTAIFLERGHTLIYHPHHPKLQDVPLPTLTVLLSREQIQKRVAEVAAEISRDFHGQPVVLIGILKGATIFLSDLARSITLDATFDFISVSSYGSQKQSSGEVKLNKDVDNSMEGKNVILVEDILDTGLTMTYLIRILKAHHPKSLKIAALLDKASRRIAPIHADYVGFEIPDKFVVGYGMDAAERYRNLPDICVVEE